MPALPQHTSDSLRSTSSRPGIRPSTARGWSAHALGVSEMARVVVCDARRHRVEARGTLHVELREDLHHVANPRRKARGARRPERIVGEQRAVLLHRRTASGAVDDDVVDVEGLHLGDELAHPLQRRLLAAGVDLERTAAALQRRDQHFAAVGGEHTRGGSIDVREERVLHAPGEQRDPLDALSPRVGGGAASAPRDRRGGAMVPCRRDGAGSAAPGVAAAASCSALRSPSACVSATADARVRIRRGWGSTANSAARDARACQARAKCRSICGRTCSTRRLYCTPDGQASTQAMQPRHASQWRTTSSSMPTSPRAARSMSRMRPRGESISSPQSR